MNKPCNFCVRAKQELKGDTLEPECDRTCSKFNAYARDISKKLDDLLERGNAILERHKN